MPSTNDHRWLSRLLCTAVVSTALVPLAVPPSHAGSVQQVDPAPALAATPGSEPGQFRTWVQLVWNPSSRVLERLTFTAWDPIPSLGLELSWQPDDPADTRAGPIEGHGTLSFRTPGAPAYDPGGTVAQYRGSMTGGRAEGQGEFFDVGGFSYAGAWRGGLMEGQGHLALANGDEYTGTFRASLRDGEGTLIDSTGRVWTGRFTAGIPDAALLAAQADTGLRLSVVTERRPHNYELGLDPLSYVARSAGETLTILPDDQRLLDVWHGTVPITMTDDEVAAFNGATIKSFLGDRERFDPVSVVFALENTTTATVSVLGGYVDVATSRRNKEPAIQLRPVALDECGSAGELAPRFYLDNFGWTTADNAELNFSAGSRDGRSEGTPLNLSLGTIADTADADLGPQMASLGVDTAEIPERTLTCSDPTTERVCLSDLRQSGHFGSLADYISLDYDKVVVEVSGTLDYDWTGGDGAANHKTSRFNAVVPLARVLNAAECGEGGEIIPIRKDPYELKLDADAYRIPLAFAADITPGFTTRWRIELLAPETSDHAFRIVLLLSDGSQVVSRPIEMTYFMPPEHEASATF